MKKKSKKKPLRHGGEACITNHQQSLIGMRA
jgi:hypothetical protein